MAPVPSPVPASLAARRRVRARAGAAAAAVAAAGLLLSACSGDGNGEGAGAASGTVGPSQEAVNDGSSIPKKPLSAAKSKAAVLTEAEIPGGVSAYRERRIGVQRLDLGRALGGVEGLNSECSTAVKAATKNKASVLSGARVDAKLPATASGTSRTGTVRITVYTSRKSATPSEALNLISDKCSGTVNEPDAIEPIQRGMQGVSVKKGSKVLGVAGGDWGSNHALVETRSVDTEVVQQIVDAQLAKLSAGDR